MQYLKLLAFLVLVMSCSSKKFNRVSIKHQDPITLGKDFIEDLKKAKTDTIYAFYDSYFGSSSAKENPFYVIWVKKNKTFITKFTEYAKFNTLNKEGLNSSIPKNILDSLENENLVVPKNWINIHSFQKVEIILNNRQFSYEIRGYEKPVNKETYHVFLTELFQSYLAKINERNGKVKITKTLER